MSKTKRATAPQSASARSVARTEPAQGDPLTALLRVLVVGLLLVRWLIPAESAGAGDTLWIVQLDFAAVIVWAWSRLRSADFTVRRTLFDWTLWALVGAHCLAAGFVFVSGGDRRTALNMAWEWVGLGATFFLVRQTIHTALAARRFAMVVVALGVVLSGLGIWQHYVSYRLASREYFELISELETLEKNPSANPDRLGELQLTLLNAGIPADKMERRQYVNRLQFSSEAFGPFALANTFAGLLLVALVLAGELFRTLEGPRSKWTIAVWGAAFVVLLYCLILTKSRTAWTGLLVAGAIWGVAILIRSREWLTRRTMLWFGLGTAGVLILFAIAALGKGFDVEVIREAPKSLSYRFQYWKGAADTLAASPIFGAGPGNFRQHYLRYKVAASSEEIVDPHNWFLDLWASGGILAVVSFLACVVLALVPGRARLLPSSAAQTIPKEGSAGASPSRDNASDPTPGWTTDLAGPVLAFVLAVGAPVVSGTGVFDWWQFLRLAAWVIAFAILQRNLGSSRLALIAIGAGALGLMIHLSGAGGIEMPAVVQLLLVLVALAFATRERPADVANSFARVMAIGGAGVVLFVALLFTSTLPVLSRHAAIASGEQALYVSRRFDLAESDFLQAAHNDPLSPEPHDKLADAYFSRWQASPPGDSLDYFAKARAALAEAMYQDPLNPSRYRRLGEFYSAKFARSQDPADAKAAAEAFGQAVDMYPTDAMTRSAYATALADAGKVADAKTQAQKALEQDEINHDWGHTDRYLPDEVLARLRRLAAGG